MSETTRCPTDGIIEAASTWLVILRDVGVSTEDKAAFADWLLQSPTHTREYLYCDLVWSWLQQIDWDKVAVDERIRTSANGRSPSRSVPKLH